MQAVWEIAVAVWCLMLSLHRKSAIIIRIVRSINQSQSVLKYLQTFMLQKNVPFLDDDRSNITRCIDQYTFIPNCIMFSYCTYIRIENLYLKDNFFRFVKQRSVRNLDEITISTPVSYIYQLELFLLLSEKTQSSVSCRQVNTSTSHIFLHPSTNSSSAILKTVLSTYQRLYDPFMCIRVIGLMEQLQFDEFFNLSLENMARTWSRALKFLKISSRQWPSSTSI